MSKKHGPYLYAYWNEGDKTKSRYVGKKLEDYDLRSSQLLKVENRGNELAKQYLEKLRNKKVSIDWAHIVLINRIREQNELIKFIFSEIDPSNEEDLRGYLNKSCNTCCFQLTNSKKQVL